MLKHILLTLFIIAPLSNLMAQSANDRAKAYYIQAELDYDDGDYTDAINNLNKVEEILGSTNARVLGLKVKAYYGKGDYANAQKSLDQFSQYSSKASDALVKEVFAYIPKVEAKLKEAEEKERQDAIVRKQQALEKAEHDKKVRLYKERTAAAQFEAKLIAAAKEAHTTNNTYNDGLLLIEMDNKYGYVTRYKEEGELFPKTIYDLVIPCIYDYASAFSEGYASVTIDGKKGYINQFGEIVIPLQYTYTAGPFTKGKAWVGNDFRHSSVINKQGDVLFSVEDMSSGFYELWAEGTAIVRGMYDNDDHMAIINTKGNLITDFEYEEIRHIVALVDTSHHCYEVTLSGKKGIINTKGETIVPIEYERFGWNYSCGLIRASKIINGVEKFCYLDQSGNVVIDFEYADCRRFDTVDAFAIVKTFNPLHKSISYLGDDGYSYGVIDKDGEMLIAANYDFIEVSSSTKKITGYKNDSRYDLTAQLRK